MEEILKENKSSSHKEFEKLLSEDLGNRKFKEGEIATGTVEEIGKKFVFIDLGLKSSGAIPVEEFKLTKEINEISVGKKITVFLIDEFLVITNNGPKPTKTINEYLINISNE